MEVLEVMELLEAIEVLEVMELFDKMVDVIATMEDMMRSQILSISSMECMITSITQTLQRKDLVMRLVTLRESTLLLFLMVGYSMLSTMLMGTMVAPSWRCLARGNQDKI